MQAMISALQEDGMENLVGIPGKGWPLLHRDVPSDKLAGGDKEGGDRGEDTGAGDRGDDTGTGDGGDDKDRSEGTGTVDGGVVTECDGAGFNNSKEIVCTMS